jgi:hypothetical protein
MKLKEYLKQFDGLDPELEIGILVKNDADEVYSNFLRTIKPSILYSYQYGLNKYDAPFASDIENFKLPKFSTKEKEFTLDKKVLSIGTIIIQDLFR